MPTPTPKRRKTKPQETTAESTHPLRHYRNTHGLSLRALAARTREVDPSGKGLTYARLSQLETGGTPTLEAMDLVALATDRGVRREDWPSSTLSGA